MANIIKQFKDSDGNNVYPLAYAQGGMKMDLLWTNPQPGQSFAEQTVNLNLNGYDLFFVTFYRLRSDISQEPVPYTSTFAIKGTAGVYNSNSYLTASGASYSTRAFKVNDNGIAFGNGKGSDTQNNNDRAIPYQIYGIKMSYIVPTQVHGLQYIEV